MIGRTYVARIPTFNRSILANEVLIRVSAPSTGIILVKRAFFAITGGDNLNETEAIEIVILSTDGTGGGTVVFEPRAPGEPAFGGSGLSLDANGWTAQPTVTDQLEQLGYNLAGQWEWAPQDEDDYILVPTSARIGLRHIGAISSVSPAVAYDCYGGLVIHEMD